MNDEAESSTAAPHRNRDVDDVSQDDDDQLEAPRDEDRDKEFKLAARRKRVGMLSELLRELDMIVYMQLITVYHLDCSFFWLAVKALIHCSLLTPMPDTPLDRQPDEPKLFLPFLLFSFGATSLLHLVFPAPSAGEDTRGYLHGGLVIDFIGQQGPTNKWKLAAFDMSILLLQLVMLSVHVKRRELNKKLANPSDSTTHGPAQEQDADDEERGVLHRTDTLSDVGLDSQDDDDGQALLPSTSAAAHSDALDTLTSGQSIIGHFTLIDTLLNEHKNYSSYRLTRSETHVNDMPETLRRLNTLRTRFGVGGG